MTSETAIAINVQNLSVSFHRHHILHDISSTFAQKSITVLVGRSGSGKTTFLRSLNRLNEEYDGCSMQGRIDIDIGQGLQCAYQDGKPAAMDIQFLRRKVGMLFQSPQLLPVSIYRNMTMPLELVGELSSKNAEQKTEEMLELVGLWDEVKDRLNLPAEKLSGGQQQRLCLARTLALDPTILLLDEPTSSLDIKATEQIETLLLELKKHYTLVMVSHSLEQAKRLADTLLIFENGKIAQNYADTAGLQFNELAQWFHQ